MNESDDNDMVMNIVCDNSAQILTPPILQANALTIC